MPTRSRRLLLSVPFLVLGCGEAAEERTVVAEAEVPAKVREVAKSKLGDLKVEGVWKEVEDGKEVYEYRAKTRTGKVRELEIQPDGTVVLDE